MPKLQMPGKILNLALAAILLTLTQILPAFSETPTDASAAQPDAIQKLVLTFEGIDYLYSLTLRGYHAPDGMCTKDYLKSLEATNLKSGQPFLNPPIDELLANFDKFATVNKTGAQGIPEKSLLNQFQKTKTDLLVGLVTMDNGHLSLEAKEAIEGNFHTEQFSNPENLQQYNQALQAAGSPLHLSLTISKGPNWGFVENGKLSILDKSNQTVDSVYINSASMHQVQMH